MNYRHQYHAGNFADVVKHALLLGLLARLTGDPAPLEVVDTHAGAGSYDLKGEEARRSGEARAGVVRLMADAAAPAAFATLKAAVGRADPGAAAGEISAYAGSPLLVLEALRPGDRWLGCELREDDHRALAFAVRAATRPDGPAAEVRRADGFAAATTLPAGPRRTLLVVDPPYERGDDDARIVQMLAAVRRRRPDLTALIWAPIKDLAGFDALLSGLEGLGFPEGLAAQVRLRPLANPLRLNGCAVLILGAAGLAGSLRTEAGAICGWAVDRLGEPGGRALVEPLD